MGKQKILKQLLVFALFLLSSVQMMRADLLVQVNVTKPGTMKAEILAKPGVTSLADVTALSVSGALNEQDQTAFPDMVNLEVLNLKEADFYYMKQYCDNLKNLKTVILPATVTDIAWDAFRRCENLTDLWCYAYMPAGRRVMPDQSNLTIHVPDYSVEAYKANAYYAASKEIVPIGATANYMNIYTEYTLTDASKLPADVTIGTRYMYYPNPDFRNFGYEGDQFGRLTVATPGAINIGTLVTSQDFYVVEGYKYGTSVIAKSTINANRMVTRIYLQHQDWNFICLPYDVKVSDIECSDNLQWTVRRYSGSDRAKMTGNTWVNAKADETLKAGEGFIIHFTNPEITTWWLMYEEFTFPSSQPVSLKDEDAVVSLKEYDSEFAHNRSWNLVGNPYPSYYYTPDLNHDGIITVWENGLRSKYVSYSLTDDSYMLHPNEAFFVQRQPGADRMTFSKTGRSLSPEASMERRARAATRAMRASDRQIYNLILTDGTTTDRTRLVVNPNASEQYELNCDASKMMTDNALQLYLKDGGQAMAIDERPMPEAPLALGMVIPEKGRYTIEVAEHQSQKCDVILTDRQTGENINLNNGSYTFECEKGSVSSRFAITVTERGLTSIPSDDYNPEGPGNPGANYFDATSGLLILDDIKTGKLGDIMQSLTGGDYDKVRILRIGGVVTDEQLYTITQTFNNVTEIDLSRVSGLTWLPHYVASHLSKLSRVILPAGLETMGERLFNGCEKLTEIICFAVTPPVAENSAEDSHRSFYGIPNGVVAKVPKNSVSLYKAAPEWKDLIILAMSEGESYSINVNLPDDATSGKYYGMTLVLDNLTNKTQVKYVMTDKKKYEFANLPANSAYNISIKTLQGAEIVRKDGIQIEKESVTVNLTGMSQTCDLSLSVTDPAGKDLSAQCTITWYDSKGEYVGRGATLMGVVEGSKYSYTVALPESLALQYVAPAKTEVTVPSRTAKLICKLTALKAVTYGGKVVDAESGRPVYGAAVTLVQEVNGLQKTAVTATDTNGAYQLQGINYSGRLTVAQPTYRTVEQDIAATDKASVAISDIKMEVLNGTIFFADLSGYENHTDVTYTLYNNTRGKEITDFFVQGLQIVADPKLTPNDEIKITATSKSCAFETVSGKCTVIEGEPLTVVLPIVSHGKLTAQYEKCAQTVDVVGMLYNAAGEMVTRDFYQNAQIAFGNLKQGTYTLVTMMQHSLYNSVLKYSELSNMGLAVGTDYVTNQVSIVDGDEAHVVIDEVPVMKDSKSLYITDESYVTVNNPLLTVGNYVTLSAKPVFKAEIAGQVKDVNLVIDLPESCTLVAGSVLTASGISDYTQDKSRVIIPLTDMSAPARCCVVSGIAGEYMASVKVEFMLNGSKCQQPLGAADFTYQTYSITAPVSTITEEVRVAGAAPAMAPVKVYDDGALIGETYANGNGTWSVKCRLHNPTNLSVHRLKAVIGLDKGIDVETNVVECKINKNGNAVRTITMSYYNAIYDKVVNVVFDQENGQTNTKSYLIDSNEEITFIVNLVNNSPDQVAGVTVNVFLSDNTVERLPASYDKASDRWVAKKMYRMNEALPNNVSANIASKEKPIVRERKELDDKLDNVIASSTVLSDIRDKYNKMLAALPTPEPYVPQAEAFISEKEVKEWAAAGYDTFVKNLDAKLAEFDKANEQWLTGHDELMQELDATLAADNEFYAHYPDSVFAQIRLSADGYAETFDKKSTRMYSGDATISQTPITSVDKMRLEADGYMYCQLDDNSGIWAKFDETVISVVDTKKMMRYDKQMPAGNSSAQARMLPNTNAVTAAGKYDHTLLKKCANTISGEATIFTVMKGQIGEEWTWNNIGRLISSSFFTLMEGSECIATGIADLCNAVLKNMEEAQQLKNEKKVLELQQKMDDVQKRLKINADKSSSLKNTLNGILTHMNDPQAETIWKPSYEALSQEYDRLARESAQLGSKVVDIQQTINKAKNASNWLLDIARPVLKWADNFNFKELVKKGDKFLGGLGKFMGAVGIISSLVDTWNTASQGLEDLSAWNDVHDLLMEYYPCEDDAANFNAIRSDMNWDANQTLLSYCGVLSAMCGAILSDIVGIVDAEIAIVETWSFVVSAILNSGASIVKDTHLEYQRAKPAGYQGRIMALKCFKRIQSERHRKGNANANNNASGNGNNDGVAPSAAPSVTDVHDPAGYVYEAVPDNRLEGVTTTCFYKDENNLARFWDAEEYDQKNPLLTDENGFYQWFVPTGTWMVKYEKTGYETTYSDWLPVPPPQLEVNVGMNRLIQPEVQYVEAHTTGIDIYFDTHMMADVMREAGNVSVVANNRVVSGTVTLLEGNGETADAFRFVPDAEITDDTKVVVTVSKRVQSYTGLQMGSDYQQTFTIDPTAIDEVEADESASAVSGTSRLYDILGRAVRRLTTDQYVIQDGKVIVVE